MAAMNQRFWQEKAVMQILQEFNRLEHCAVNCVDTASACQYSFWNAVTFGATNFQVDIKEGVGGGGDLTLMSS